MTAAQTKDFFRTVIKVVAGGPAVGTVGSNRAAGLLSALDKVVDFVAGLSGAPAWVAGVQKEGALVYYDGATYRVQQDLDSAQPPGSANTNYLLVGPGGAGTVKTVNGIAPGADGDVLLPLRDVHPSQAKRQQVVGFFTSGTQTTAADVALSGDTTSYFFSEFYDFSAGYWYKCLPNPTQPDGQGHATAWWVRR